MRMNNERYTVLLYDVFMERIKNCIIDDYSRVIERKHIRCTFYSSLFLGLWGSIRMP